MHTLPKWLRQLAPSPLKCLGNGLFWLWYDARDFLAEQTGHLWFHGLRLWVYRHLLGITVGPYTSMHRNCRFYRPSHISVGKNTIINRDVLLDGRRGLYVGDNVSISEDVVIFTLEHDPNSPDFASRGAEVRLEDYVFVGARAIILPGISIGRGGVVASGAMH